MVGIQSGDKPTLMGVQTIQVDIDGTVGIYITSQHCQNMVDGCEILHQLIGGKHPTFLGFHNHPLGGAGFLPSTVCL